MVRGDTNQGVEGRINETEAKQIVQKALQDKVPGWIASTTDPVIAALVVKLKLLFGVTTGQELIDKINDITSDKYNFVETIK
jgi:hypothetical protein